MKPHPTFNWRNTPAQLDTRSFAHASHHQAITAHRAGVDQPLPRTSINTEATTPADKHKALRKGTI